MHRRVSGDARRSNNDSIRYVFTRPRIPDSRLELNRRFVVDLSRARKIAAARAFVIGRRGSYAIDDGN